MKAQPLLLITPPFVQPNAPYSATPFLKGFLNARKIPSAQVDLSLEVLLAFFSSEGLTKLFGRIKKQKPRLSGNASRIMRLRKDYINTIDDVISFMQGKKPSLAKLICEGNYLPEAFRFEQAKAWEWALDTMKTTDRAKHLATLYLEDLTDLINETIDPDFGFSRYAERLGASASIFDGIEEKLNRENGFLDEILTEKLEAALSRFKVYAIALSVPFPGNLYGALKCGQWIKNNRPEIKIIMGGGYVNTELRSLKDPRVFSYVDYICLDDGEAPLLNLIEYLDGHRELRNLKRTFALKNGKVHYFDASETPDFHQRNSAVPDYSELSMKRYFSTLGTVNPMHRLWSDGKWNRLILAHGCYWGKCAFCDTTLDYIKRYEPDTAASICAKMETLIKQTGQKCFHFVDEAAPPALLRELALEIIRRKLKVRWWTNVRFEKSFTPGLCALLKKSGCIAVSGGLEAASDRVLKLINKGMSVSQAVKTAANFAGAGIMVHTYLMYGFPTQTAQETIDSLEVVRQMFMHGIVQSAFWHRFAMTVHSKAGKKPQKFNAACASPRKNPFANNELACIDRKGCSHGKFSEGLRKSLFNYMHGAGFEFSLGKWFGFKVPETKTAPDFVSSLLTGKVSGK